MSSSCVASRPAVCDTRWIVVRATFRSILPSFVSYMSRTIWIALYSLLHVICLCVRVLLYRSLILLLSLKVLACKLCVAGGRPVVVISSLMVSDRRTDCGWLHEGVALTRVWSDRSVSFSQLRHIRWKRIIILRCLENSIATRNVAVLPFKVFRLFAIDSMKISQLRPLYWSWPFLWMVCCAGRLRTAFGITNSSRLHALIELELDLRRIFDLMGNTSWMESQLSIA